MMQFGIFTVGDVTTDPTTGRTPTEAGRDLLSVAQTTEEANGVHIRPSAAAR